LKVHEDHTYPGAIVASLSVPWGNSSNSSGGYHLVWTRDAAEAGFGLLAVAQHQDACRMLSYLVSTQGEDGHWSQNYFPDGRPYWSGIQLDEVGFPVLLAAKLLEVDSGRHMTGVVAMMQKAARFIARGGPVSPQDRWEENAGISPFTLAVEIAALVAAAEVLDAAERSYALSLADYWNERVEDWTYVENSPLDLQFGTGGHYIRIAPAACDGGPRGRVNIKNRADQAIAAAVLVGLDYLYLLRMGLRRADDPRMQDTLKIVEKLLRVDTPLGPAYHRYNEDGYGEHEDGSPFDGTGIGRAWPLLTGERGLLDLQLGTDPLPYLEAMARMTGPGGLIPEQVWDSSPIPDRYLQLGRPAGSAMPLVWAHAEFLKLLRARQEGKPIELLRSVEARYRGQRPAASCWHWRQDTPFERIPAGRDMLFESLTPFVLHWGYDGWQSVEDRPSSVLAFGINGVRLTHTELRNKRMIDFTFYYPEEGRWAGIDNHICVVPPIP
jgi:glucoamylase